MLYPLINLLYYIAIILLVARAILSWVRPDPYHEIWGPFMRFVYQATEPALAPIRRHLPPMGMMDFSPMVLWLILRFLRVMLLSILY